MKMDKGYYFKSNSGRVGIVTLLLLLSVMMLPAFSNMVYGEQSAPLAYPLINDSEGTGKIIPASGYVVEFTYGENQYVLSGDSSVRLDELLSGISLEGTVSGYQVSAPDLFNIFPGDEIGLSGGADIMDLHTERSMELLKEVRQFVEENPSIAAQMVKTWLRGGEEDA